MNHRRRSAFIQSTALTGNEMMWLTNSGRFKFPLPMGFSRPVWRRRASAVLKSLPRWFDHYNAIHPHSALRYRSPREFIAAHSNREAVSGF
jgi:transposase InsO family protein